MTLSASFGYGSKEDGNVYHLDLCEKCFKTALYALRDERRTTFMFDVKRKLPLFTKSGDSKSLYCAGYYVIRFDKGWVKSFCPKAITLQRYEYQGPFKTSQEMKTVLNSLNKNETT